MQQRYRPPQPALWQGRSSDKQLYLHEKVLFADLSKGEALPEMPNKLGILGYACDEGVRRNFGRVGAKKGPGSIREAFSKMPNHLPEDHLLIDFGDVICDDGDMEASQRELADQIVGLKNEHVFCVVLGGGHDLAYAHFNGLKKSLGPQSSLGIINFDAHFDLRSNENGNHSGTPFYQIGQECTMKESPFHYLCLGVRKDANDSALYDTTSVLGVNYLEMERFQISQLELINQEIEYFLKRVDAVYVTIDLDGFSSAYAPGVSAPSPMGFNPEIVQECLKTIIHSKKLAGIDIAEMNPDLDRDYQTARLAASLLHFILHRISLF